MIYFIAEENRNRVKIGFTKNHQSLLNRINYLQVGNSDNLILISVKRGGYNYEKSLHKRFEYEKIRGEWFELSERVLNFINSDEEEIPKEKKADALKYIQEHLYSAEIKVNHQDAWHKEWIDKLGERIGLSQEEINDTLINATTICDGDF